MMLCFPILYAIAFALVFFVVHSTWGLALQTFFALVFFALTAITKTNHVSLIILIASVIALYSLNMFIKDETLLQISEMGCIALMGCAIINHVMKETVCYIATAEVFLIHVMILNVYWLIVKFPSNLIFINNEMYYETKSDFVVLYNYMFVFVLVASTSASPVAFFLRDRVNDALVLVGTIPWHAFLLSVMLNMPYWFFHQYDMPIMEIEGCALQFKEGKSCHQRVYYNETIPCCRYSDVVDIISTVLFVLVIYLGIIALECFLFKTYYEL